MKNRASSAGSSRVGTSTVTASSLVAVGTPARTDSLRAPELGQVDDPATRPVGTFGQVLENFVHVSS
jgi:hypothetical protein